MTDRSSASTVRSASSLLKILVATDIHLGYGEENHIQTDDSFITFEEILQIAQLKDVDMILLGGDLFHISKPTPKSLNKCIELLGNYVLGDKATEFDLLQTDGSADLEPNYEDPNINVSYPVFTIHGNHDDFTGTDRRSCMDIMHSTKLLNYFGKWTDLEKIEIKPLIIQKNETKVALYGLSHIHDARLARLYRDHKVEMVKPRSIPEDELFNMMVLHQNRAERGRMNFLPESELPVDFLDLVIWGHEHDCRIELEQNPRTRTWICQPGSSIATSLCEGEAIEKKVGILEIHKREFKMHPVKLNTVRPFVFRSINIEELADDLRLLEGNVKAKLNKFYEKNVEEMIVEAKAKITRNPNQPKEPLIRLRVIFTNDDFCINPARFSQQYLGRVANPESVIHFKKQTQKREKTANFVPDDAAMRSAFAKKEQQDTVEDVVESFFGESNDDNQLKIFNLKTLTEICRLLVKDDNVVSDVLEAHSAMAHAYLTEKACAGEEILDYLKEFQSQKSMEALRGAEIASNSNFTVPSSRSINDVLLSSNSAAGSSTQASTARGGRTARGRAAATSASTRATSSRATKASENNGSSARSTAGGTQAKSQRTATRKSVYIDISDEDD